MKGNQVSAAAGVAQWRARRGAPGRFTLALITRAAAVIGLVVNEGEIYAPCSVLSAVVDPQGNVWVANSMPEKDFKSQSMVEGLESTGTAGRFTDFKFGELAP
jgi:hypothetical protein